MSVMPVEVMDVHCVEDMAMDTEMLSLDSMVTALRLERTWVTIMSPLEIRLDHHTIRMVMELEDAILRDGPMVTETDMESDMERDMVLPTDGVSTTAMAMETQAQRDPIWDMVLVLMPKSPNFGKLKRKVGIPSQDNTKTHMVMAMLGIKLSLEEKEEPRDQEDQEEDTEPE